MEEEPTRLGRREVFRDRMSDGADWLERGGLNRPREGGDGDRGGGVDGFVTTMYQRNN